MWCTKNNNREAAPSYNMSVEMCFALYGESDTRCVLPETTQPPATDDCSSGITGIFCLSDQSGFIVSTFASHSSNRP